MPFHPFCVFHQGVARLRGSCICQIMTCSYYLPVLIKNYNTIYVDSPLPGTVCSECTYFGSSKQTLLIKHYHLHHCCHQSGSPGSWHCLPISSLTPHRYPPPLPSPAPLQHPISHLTFTPYSSTENSGYPYSTPHQPQLSIATAPTKLIYNQQT
jgi:hypothetical protein